MVVLIAVPVIGVLMGGIYSLPAMRLTKSREPGFTLLLAIGLSITVVSIGFAFGMPLLIIGGALLCSLLALAVRRWFGKLDGNVERFGIIHGFTLAGMFWLVLAMRSL
jgi:hypothetical protein